MVDRVALGTAAVTRVVEWRVDRLPLTLFPETPPSAWSDVGADYSPTFWEGEHWRIAVQTWVVEVDGLTVLVDTGVGNDRIVPPCRRWITSIPTTWTPCSAPALRPNPSMWS